MYPNRVGLYSLLGAAMVIISLIAASNLWLFLGWMLGTTFVLCCDDGKVPVTKEPSRPSNKMLTLNRNTWYDD